MELMSSQMVGTVVISVILVGIVPERLRTYILAGVSLYVLFINNNIINFMITIGLLVIVYGSTNYFARRQQTYIIISLLVLVLVVEKYLNFFISLANGILGLFDNDIALETYQIDAPFGVSYFILILISYVLSSSWNILRPKRHIGEFINTVCFFPLWFMGPILSGEDMSTTRFKITYQSLTFGLQRIGWGILKKLFIAERCALIVNEVYGNYENYSGFYIIIAIMLFVLQLYADFSGAIDIVLGITEIFGKKLPENFKRPFSSISLSEFWRRWHITLGAWLKNFVLYPILKSQSFRQLEEITQKKFGIKKGKKIVTYTGLLISWFLIGLWHGGGWNYIFGVGIYMWIVIVGGEILQPLFDILTRFFRIRKNSGGYLLFSKLRTTALFAFGLHFFRADSIEVGFKMLQSMVTTFNPEVLTHGSLLYRPGLEKQMAVWLIGVLIMVFVAILQKRGNVREQIAKQHIIIRWGVYYSLILLIIILGQMGMENEVALFIYQQF